MAFRIVYSSGYDLQLGPHVFPAQKYRLVWQSLLERHPELSACVAEPDPAAPEDLARVHHAGYLGRLLEFRLGPEEARRLEIPWHAAVANAVLLATGGSLLAARLALSDGCAANLSGGFHHAHPGHGEGFCALHDVGIATRRLQAEGQLRRALVVDCDVHQGNGTAAVFAGDRSVFTFSIHQENNYPVPKAVSDLDIGLEDGLGDEEYLDHLNAALRRIVPETAPDLIWYVAGADPYHDDQLGGLALTRDGLRARDRLVLETAWRAGVPVAIVLAGGYARRVEDTVAIHAATVETAMEFEEPAASAS